MYGIWIEGSEDRPGGWAKTSDGKVYTYPTREQAAEVFEKFWYDYALGFRLYSRPYPIHWILEYRKETLQDEATCTQCGQHLFANDTAFLARDEDGSYLIACGDECLSEALVRGAGAAIHVG